MQQIKIEATLVEKLAALKGEVILLDEHGRALGFFSPLDRSTKSDELELEPPRSIAETEELRKRARANPGRPLKDILNDLGY